MILQGSHTVAEAIAEAEPKAEARGEIKGESRINVLYSWLFKNNRIEDARKATTDSDYRAKLLKEFDEASQDTAQSPDQNS